MLRNSHPRIGILWLRTLEQLLKQVPASIVAVRFLALFGKGVTLEPVDGNVMFEGGEPHEGVLATFALRASLTSPCCAASGGMVHVSEAPAGK